MNHKGTLKNRDARAITFALTEILLRLQVKDQCYEDEDDDEHLK